MLTQDEGQTICHIADWMVPWLARCRAELAEIECDFAAGNGTVGHVIGWLDWHCEIHLTGQYDIARP